MKYVSSCAESKNLFYIFADNCFKSMFNNLNILLQHVHFFQIDKNK